MKEKEITHTHTHEISINIHTQNLLYVLYMHKENVKKKKLCILIYLPWECLLLLLDRSLVCFLSWFYFIRMFVAKRRTEIGIYFNKIWINYIFFYLFIHTNNMHSLHLGSEKKLYDFNYNLPMLLYMRLLNVYCLFIVVVVIILSALFSLFFFTKVDHIGIHPSFILLSSQFDFSKNFTENLNLKSNETN